MSKHIRNALFLWLLCGLTAFAQDITVSGRVTSSDDGAALPGVSVQVQGTTRGTTTDGQGNYKITATSKARLVFSFIGYTGLEEAIGNRTTINVALQSNAAELNEVVVRVGYGAAVSKREATGATANVKGEVIENLPLQSFDRALQGRTAGVQVTSNNGTPGGAVQVRIRGVGSISAGNEPLYIVDGVQLNNRNDGGNVSNNPLSFLNPNDIESIDILKDAATAAIYGAQAANGVVLVTTKRGKAGAKSRVTINMYRGVVEPIRQLNVLNTQQFIKLRQEALVTNTPTLTPTSSLTSVLSSLNLPVDLGDQAIAALPTYNWQEEAYRPGSVTNADISVQGGNDKTTYYISGAYNKQDAILRNVDFQRFSGKMNLTTKLNNKVTLDAGLTGANVVQRGPYGGAEGSLAFGAPQYSAPLILPINPIYNPDGSYYGLPASGIVMPGDLSQNVIANSNLIKSKTSINQLVSNLGLTYAINKDLILKAFGGLDYRSVNSSFFGDPRLSDYFNIRGTLNQFVNNNINLTTNATLNYNHTFGGKHTVGALLGTEYRQETNETTTLNAQGFPTPELNTANAAAEPVSVGGFWSSFKRAGIFTNLRYEYGKRYIVSGILRYDGSSRFGSNNRWGYFPSISAKWNIAEENFLKSSTVVSDLGLRFSVGSTGNDQVNNFAARRLYGLGGVYQGNAGIGVSQLGNPDLRWERNVTYNIGLDYGFFGGRVKGSIDAFERISRDLLLTRSIPQTNGFNSIFENIGEVKNRGLEFDITTINVNAGSFRWETNFNITFLDNKVTKLFEGADVLPGNLSVRVGYPLLTNVGVPYAGVNPANGRPMWYDPNGNITYIVRTADQRPLGHSGITKQFGGFTNTFTYKGFELSGLLQYDLGRTIQNSQEFRLADNAGVLRNGLTYYYDNRWTTPGQITSIPRPANNRTEISGRVSSYQSGTRFFQDASYLRLKQVTLSYTVPTTVISRLKLSGVKVYAQAINAFTWTKWTGFDPEFTIEGGLDNQGIIPQSRNYTLGVQIGL
jgi:TonB-dependent starch-binding outer membrane protein SusC